MIHLRRIVVKKDMTSRKSFLPVQLAVSTTSSKITILFGWHSLLEMPLKINKCEQTYHSELESHHERTQGTPIHTHVIVRHDERSLHVVFGHPFLIGIHFIDCIQQPLHSCFTFFQNKSSSSSSSSSYYCLEIKQWNSKTTSHCATSVKQDSTLP